MPDRISVFVRVRPTTDKPAWNQINETTIRSDLIPKTSYTFSVPFYLLFYHTI